MTITALHADSRVALKEMADASIDACVTDPPYGLNFMGRHWDGENACAFDPAFWTEVLRVLKPGAHLIAFGGTRTYHRLVCAIEDAGFEVRDQLAWIFGSGFPKSHDVSKAIDRAAGAEREVIGPGNRHNSKRCAVAHGDTERLAGGVPDITAPATDAARQWQGWGTALKPAHEPICLARKPLSGTVAANVLQHGTGALNVDASRIPSGPDHAEKCASVVGLASNRNGVAYGEWTGERTDSHSALGRWPANVLHDGSEEVLRGFPESEDGVAVQRNGGGQRIGNLVYGGGGGDIIRPDAGFGGGGSAARFFYTAKADADDRLGSKHPTVKPVDLMAYLVKLVTPPGGVVLDPFAGSGTTGMACMREGFDAILIEREAEYVTDIKRRIAHVRGEDAPLFAERA